jgi:hypothetical protein
MPGLGLKFATPDPRAHMYAGMALTIPSKPVILRDKMPPPRNQKQTSACTAFSTCYAAEATRAIILGEKITVRSPKYIYRQTRVMEGDYPNDEGAYVIDAFKVWQKLGGCPEEDFPWDNSRDDGGINEEPTANADADAGQYKLDGYLRLGATRGQATLQAIMGWIATEQLPCVLGIQVFSSFMNPKSDHTVPMPRRNETMVGGHAICCCGVIPSKSAPGGGYLLLLNSWGDDWGDKGYVLYPFQMVLAGLTTEAWAFTEKVPVLKAA